MEPETIWDRIGSIPTWGWSVPVTLVVILVLIVVIERISRHRRMRAEYKRLCERANALRSPKDGKPARMEDAVRAASEAKRIRKRLEADGASL